MATGANLHLTTSIGNPNGALTRLEFIPIDMDPDPVTEDIQGFFRVYTNSISSNMPFVVGWQTGADGPISTSNCGVVSGPPGNATFLRYGYELDIDQAKDSVDNNRYRCFLGGDPALHPGANQSGVFEQTPTGSGPTAGGSWLPWPGPAVSGPASFMGRLDHDYLWPYTPAVNSTTKGVIFIDGEVALSGVVAGKVTVVATDDIVVVDDVTQYTDPGAAACDRDVLGLIAGDDIIISDNTLMTPQRYSTSAAYHTMGKSKDEYLQAVVMSLDEFRVQEAASGPGSGEPCEGTVQGRGCLYLTGSILAGTRGLLGFGSQGYRVRLSYNSCVETQAPPQFPATNLYEKARVYELDPANFDVAAWFTQYQM